MKSLLTLKHWQFFLLLMIYGFWPFEGSLFNTVKYIGIAVFILWAFAVGYYGQEQIERLGLKRMNVPLLIGDTIFILTTIIAAKFYTDLPPYVDKTMDYTLPVLVFMAVVAGFHVFFFAAKTLAKVEYQREVKFDDYFTNFLLMTIFLWGIWILQPKINKLIATRLPVL